MGDGDPVGQELGHVASREQRLGHDDQVLAGVDAVSDASGHDGQDVSDSLTAIVLPRKQPIASTEDQLSKLAFAPIVRLGNVAVIEK
jgi:hypothetical protein